MSEQPSQEDLEQMADAFAQQVRERATQQTIDAAEQLRELAGEEADPYTARLLAETLEDFARLPDYAEALFRRRAARTLRPRRSVREVIVGHARQVTQQLALPAGRKENEENGR